MVFVIGHEEEIVVSDRQERINVGRQSQYIFRFLHPSQTSQINPALLPEQAIYVTNEIPIRYRRTESR